MDLFTYKKSSFQYIKNHMDEHRRVFVSAAKLDGNQNLQDSYEYDEVYVDITTAIKLLDKSQDNLYHFERFFYAFDFGVCNFIIVEELAETAQSLFPFVIEEVIDYVDEHNIEIPKEFIEDSIEPKNEGKLIRITDLDEHKFEELNSNFANELFGHDIFKADLKCDLEKFRLFNKLGEHPIYSVFLLGPSGVGKTHVARLLHNNLTSNGKLAKINFGNYSSKDSLNSLIGSPRGYVGSDSGEILEKLKKSDTGVLLVDEFEKADDKVMNFFLELLEDGKFTTSQGKVVDLNGYIVVFTSNLSENHFKTQVIPELQSRLDCISSFEPVSEYEKKKYITSRFDSLVKKYEEHFDVKLDVSACDFYSDFELVQISNMRMLNRAIRNKFKDFVYST